MKKVFSFILMLTTIWSAVNAQTDNLLSQEQIKFINQLNQTTFDDFTKASLFSPITPYIFSPIKDGKVTMVTPTKSTNGFKMPNDTVAIVIKDSLIISSYASRNSSVIQNHEYDAQRRLKKYGKNDIQYYDNGNVKFFQWGSRSKEYIHHDSCITEVMYGRRENFMSQKTYCYDAHGQVVQDSSWHGTTQDSIVKMIAGYVVSHIEYDQGKIVKRTHTSYKGKDISNNSMPTPAGEDAAMWEKYNSIDTIWHSTTYYSYNEMGLITDRKVEGWDYDGENLELEEIRNHIRTSYEFVSRDPIILKVTELKKALPAGTTTLTFNKKGYLLKEEYNGYYGGKTSGKKKSIERYFIYELDK